MEPRNSYYMTFKNYGHFFFFPFFFFPSNSHDPFCLPRINVLGNNMFPSVEYPVPVGTPLISPYIKWDHSQDWDVPKAEDFPSGSKGSASASVYNIGMFVSWFCFPTLSLHFFIKLGKGHSKHSILEVIFCSFIYFYLFVFKETGSTSEMG